jgi:hypothetical protein
VTNETLTWLVPATISVLSFVFFVGAAWMTTVNSRHAMARLFERLEQAEQTVDEHDEVMIANGWIRRTMHGTRKPRHPTPQGDP